MNVLSTSKEYCHNERMGEPDLDTINEPISCTLDDCKIVVKSRVVQESIEVWQWHGK